MLMYNSGNGWVVMIEGVYVGLIVLLCFVLIIVYRNDRLLIDFLVRGGLFIWLLWEIKSNLILIYYGFIDRLLIGNMLFNVFFLWVLILNKKKESKILRKKFLIVFVYWLRDFFW